MTVKEVAEELGLAPDHVYNAIRAKTPARKMHAIRVVGQGWRVHRDEVARFRDVNVCPVDMPKSPIPPEAPDA